MAEQDSGAGAAGGGDAKGGDSKQDDKPAVSFKTEGEFLAAVAKKTKGATTQAVDAAKAEIFAALGIESAEEIAGLAERLETTKKTVSEHDKLKSQFDKQAKDYAKETKRVADLTTRLQKIAKRDALLPFVGQTVDPDVFNVLMEPLLEVDEEGAVSVKDGRKLENVVDDLFKSKAYLKKADAAQGAGTGAKEPLKKADADKGAADGKKPDDGKGGDGKKNGSNEPPKSWGHLIVGQLQEAGKLPPPTSGP